MESQQDKKYSEIEQLEYLLENGFFNSIREEEADILYLNMSNRSIKLMKNRMFNSVTWTFEENRSYSLSGKGTEPFEAIRLFVDGMKNDIDKFEKMFPLLFGK